MEAHGRLDQCLLLIIQSVVNGMEDPPWCRMGWIRKLAIFVNVVVGADLWISVVPEWKFMILDSMDEQPHRTRLMTCRRPYSQWQDNWDAHS